MHRLKFGIQRGTGLCLRLLGGLASRLFLRHPLLQRADLLTSRAVFDLSILQFLPNIGQLHP